MSITDLQDNKRFILDAHAMSIKSARELKTVHGQTVASMTKKMMKDFWLICKGAGASKDNRWAMPRTSRAQAAERFVQSASVGWLGAAEAAGEPGQRVSRGSRGATASGQPCTACQCGGQAALRRCRRGQLSC